MTTSYTYMIIGALILVLVASLINKRSRGFIFKTLYRVSEYFNNLEAENIRSKTWMNAYRIDARIGRSSDFPTYENFCEVCDLPVVRQCLDDLKLCKRYGLTPKTHYDVDHRLKVRWPQFNWEDLP